MPAVILGRRLLWTLVLAMVVGLLPLFALGGTASGAATVPNGFTNLLVEGGLSDPTAMQFAPDTGARDRLFVAEKGGKLRVIKDGRLLAKPFVDLSGKVDTRGARGLIGVAVDPNFASNRFVYVHYTQKATSTQSLHNRVSRFRAGGDVAVGGEDVVFDLDDLSTAENHNGGAIHFGKDGKLYVASGDNGQEEKVQKANNTFGKILRVNPDGTIPRDNPFFGGGVGSGKAAWAKGLRNPFTFAVQPGTGRIFINDVGTSVWEEINRGARGADYGWPRYEGPSSPSPYTRPIFAYKHGDTSTTGCAITGGAFYNPTASRFPPSYAGDYFFADTCNGWIRRLDSGGVGVTGFATGVKQPVDLKVGEDGALYYLSRGANSAVYRIVYTG